MKKIVIASIFAVILTLSLTFIILEQRGKDYQKAPKPTPKNEYWLLLHRKSNKEYLFHGVAGEKNMSKLMRTMTVKAGIPGQQPTPLPKLAGRDYWLLTEKLEAFDNVETAPYFLVLDVPIPETPPYGPDPYLECDGQCNWELPGYFGLHGINGDLSRLSPQDMGSSGCVRHRDEDITYLYNLFDLSKNPVRYYIEDV